MKTEFMKYEVPVYYQGGDTYIVEADSKEQAMELAEQKWRDHAPPDLPMNSWESVSNFGDVVPLEKE